MCEFKINLSRMFMSVAPWDCSNSVANLGDQAGRLTWESAKIAAASAQHWLLDNTVDALCDAVRDDARASGGWEREEIDAWTELDCLAYFVQTVASHLRGHTNVDDVGVEDCWGASDEMCTLNLQPCDETGSRIAYIYLGI